MAEVLVRRHKHYTRWMHRERRPLPAAKIRSILLGAAEAVPGFLLAYAEVLGIPSGMYAAWAAAEAACDLDARKSLVGALAAFALRFVWGLPARWDMPVTLALLLLAPMVVYGRNTAVLMGYTAAVMIPAAVAGVTGATAADLLLGLASVPLSALSAPLMARAIKGIRTGRQMDSMEERVAVGYTAALLLCGGARMLVLGVNVGMLLAAAGVTALAMVMGAGAACAGGMISGVMLALQGFPVSNAAALALGGFLAGIVRLTGRRSLTCAGFAVGCLLMLLVSGSAGQGRAAAVLLAAILVACAPGTMFERMQSFLRRFLSSRAAPGDAYAAYALGAWEKTVAAMARSVPSPGQEMQNRTPAWWQSRLCEGCAEWPGCGCMAADVAIQNAERIWAARNSPDDAWHNALNDLRGLGCARLYHLMQSMEYLRMEEAALTHARLRANAQRDMLITHLTAMAGAARRFALLSSGESWWDDVTARRIRREIAEQALPVQLSFVRRVQGHVQCAFELQYITGARKQAEELCDMTAHLLNVPMRVARLDEDRLLLAECPPLCITVGTACTSADGSDVCGDTVLTAELQDGRCMTALSDGMGHGEQAAFESRQTVELLRLCLDAGYSRPQALTAVNGMMLLAGRGERFSTVDLLLVDLWSGHAVLEKLGSAGSWLYHGGMLQRLGCESLPLGILEQIESSSADLHLKEGDVLIMMSDGTEDVFSSSDELEMTIWHALEEETPEAAARSILEAARRADTSAARDDQTAVVALVGRCAAVKV